MIAHNRTTPKWSFLLTILYTQILLNFISNGHANPHYYRSLQPGQLKLKDHPEKKNRIDSPGFLNYVDIKNLRPCSNFIGHSGLREDP